MYAPQIIKDGNVQSCPYPPLSLLVTLPSYLLLGDVRWTFLAALIGTAMLMRATAGRLGLEHGHIAELAIVVFLYHPLAFALLENSWTEPLLTLAAAACLFAMASQRSGLLGIGLGTMMATKQYGLLWLAPVAMSGRLTWRPFVAGTALAVAFTVPFFLWNPAAFWRGLVLFQIDSPFRPESLTIPAAVASRTGVQPPGVVALGAVLVVIALLAARRSRSITQTVVGSSAIFLALVLFHKGGHLNYYWFAGSLLPQAIMTSACETATARQSGG